MSAISTRLVAACLMLVSGLALAQTPSTRVRGVVEALDGSVMTVKGTTGEAVAVTLLPGYVVGGVSKATAADIKQGGFVGVGARPQPDGTLRAIQVFIFSEAMRGTGEGHRAWGVLPDSTMTNATVSETVSRVDGTSLVLSYQGGEQKVTIPAEANIIKAAPAEVTDLKPGAQVALTVLRQPDGRLTANRVTIAKPGTELPL